MTPFKEENILKWSLSLSDTLSTLFKYNIYFKDFKSKETLYADFVNNTPYPQWVNLFEYSETSNSIIVLIPYTSIIYTTTHFFSKIKTSINKNTQTLSFTEQFIAKKLSHTIESQFNQNDFSLSLKRQEGSLHLVRPFHDNQLITSNTFSWDIDSTDCGELVLCHSQAL